MQHYGADRIREALHTTDLRAAEKLCTEMSAKYNKEFSVLAESIAKEQKFPAVQVQVALTPELIPAVIPKSAGPTFPSVVLTPELKSAVVGFAKRNQLQADDSYRDLVTGFQLPEFNRQIASNKHEVELAILKEACIKRDVSSITTPILNSLLKPFSASVKSLLASEADLFHLKLEILFAKRDATRELFARDTGEGSHTDAVAPFVALNKPEPILTLIRLHELWAKDAVRNLKTSDSFLATLKQFITFVDDKPAKNITREDINNWAIQLATENYANKTIMNKVKSINAMFIVAVDNSLLLSSPASRVKTKGRGTPAKIKRAFTTPELEKLFKRPWTKQTKPKDTETYQHWIPAIGLTTGARLREICQLRLCDFKVEDGYHFIDINEEAEDASLKNQSSVRRVPIHPDLIKMGLLKYVEAERLRNTESSAMLFSELKPNNKYNNPAEKASKWWARFSDQMEVTDPDTSFHSFRYNLVKAALEIKPDPGKAVRFALTGHKDTDIGTHYYPKIHGLEPLVACVNQIKLPIDITHLMD